MPPRDGDLALVPDQITNITRRRLLTAVPLIGLMAAGIACGDDDDDVGEGEGNEGTGSPTGTTSRTIEHKFGSTVVDGVPQRIVSIGWMEQDALLALGVVPIATTEWFGDHPGAIHPWAQDELGDAPVPEVLYDSDGIDFERIATLNPDLILALYVPAGLTQEEYDRLTEIAPTLAPPAGVPDGGITWQDLTRTVGDAVDKRAQADEIVASVEARFAQAREENPQFIGALALNAYPAEDGTFQAYPPPDPGGQLLTALGFEVPQEILELADGNSWVTISSEQVRLFDIDVMLWLVDNYTQRDALLANPVYAGLNVAKEGRSVFLGYEEDGDVASATSIQTVLSLPFLLDHLVPRLAAAIDGDPSTEPA